MDLKVGLKIGQIELQFEGSASTFESKFESAFRELVEFGKGNFVTNSAEVLTNSNVTRAGRL